MRDRRNTDLSISSICSSTSTANGSVCPSQNEKQLPNSPSTESTTTTYITKENTSRSRRRSHLIIAFQICSVLTAIVVLWRVVLTKPWQAANGVDPGATEFNAIGMDDHLGILPEEPSALRVVDSKGHSRWTVQVPYNYSFPLRSKHIHGVCNEGKLLRDSIHRQSRLGRATDWSWRSSYLAADKTYLEVKEAEDTGVFPSSNVQQTGTVCDRSLTFAFDTEDASFGRTLLMLWLSYAMATKEGRAFFIDDTRWPYGKYTRFFVPVPTPKCVRPPPHHIVPCPRSANHLLVGSATLQWTLGASFNEEFLDRRKTGSEKSRRIFDLLRTGYEDLFHLTGELALYSSSRIAKFQEEASQHGGPVIGIHVRRGDLHPFEHQFSQDYLPLEMYGKAVHKLLHSQHQDSRPKTQNDFNDLEAIPSYANSTLLLASDDPEMFNSNELMQSAAPLVMQKAQERIQLPTKSRLDLTGPSKSVREAGSAYFKHEDENYGFEGGFYTALFHSLGGGLVDSDESKAGKQQERTGSAYLLDLAVLGSSDGVVCTVSSATCRLLAVMLGWDAVKEGRWLNVDDGNHRSWSWDGR